MHTALGDINNFVLIANSQYLEDTVGVFAGLGMAGVGPQFPSLAVLSHRVSAAFLRLTISLTT